MAADAGEPSREISGVIGPAQLRFTLGLDTVNTGDYLLLALLAPVLVAFGFFTASWTRSLLPRRAREHGFEVLHSERRSYRQGPFFWRSKGCAVYYIHVRRATGQELRGWIRFEPIFSDFKGEHPEVIWEERHERKP